MTEPTTKEIPLVQAVPPFEAFYRAEYRKVVGLAYALSGSRLAAEDLAQEGFIAAHKRWDTIGSYDEPGAWVRRVVANQSVSRFRRLAREAKTVALLRRERALPELEAEDDAFWGAVRSLPSRQAQAIALFYLEDLPVATIARILECSEATVRVHLHKGRQRLATLLGGSND